LAQCVKEGIFREDLYYRLNVFPIAIPPLRERKQDLEALTQHFMKTYAKKFNKSVEIIPARVITALHNYHWPGNVRELQHLIERAVILSSGTELAFGDWFQPVAENDKVGLMSTLEDIESLHIQKILETTSWRISGKNGAAEILGLNASTLRSRIKKLGIMRNA
jgi:transcriptional regulator with PAS, ATPase and Fis domain